MPKCSVTTFVESNMCCGIIRVFKNDNQSRMWERLHKTSCSKCRESDIVESTMLGLPMNYDSVAGYIGAQQNFAENRENLSNQVMS